MPHSYNLLYQRFHCTCQRPLTVILTYVFKLFTQNRNRFYRRLIFTTYVRYLTGLETLSLPTIFGFRLKTSAPFSFTASMRIVISFSFKVMPLLICLWFSFRSLISYLGSPPFQVTIFTSLVKPFQ